MAEKKWGGARPNAGRKPKSQSMATVPAEPKRAGLDLEKLMRYTPDIIRASEAYARNQKRNPKNSPFRLPWWPKNALPPKKMQMAMDALPAFQDAGQAWLAGEIMNSIAAEGLAFPGFPYLAELAQRPEYRIMSETIADDATRKWIKFEVVGEEDEKPEEENGALDAADPTKSAPPAQLRDADETEKRIKDSGKTDKVKALKDEIARLELRDKFYAACRDDGLFGRTHLFLQFGADGLDRANNPEFRVPIGDGRDALSRAKVDQQNPLRDVKLVEPVWAYPTTYNAMNPLMPGWYDPSVWYVMGTEIHASRLLRIVSRPVPDMLKPAYAFGGISLSQLAQPYVDIWLRTRQSVADLIHSFSVMVLSTDMSTILQPGDAAGLLARVALFNALRDNQGTFVVNKEKEDFKNVSAPISGLDHLQAQAQEHMAAVSRIPLVKLTGISPSGLNASSEGEIRVYYDTISAYQNRVIRPTLTRIINFAQLSLWGEIDPEITFEFEPLWEMSQKEKSEKEKADAERNEKYINMGAIAPEEIRKVVIDDPTLPYTGFDVDDIPDPPAEEGLNERGSQGASGNENGGDNDNDNDPAAEDSRARPFAGAHDAWSEADHPRGQPGNPGQFGPGGGSSKSSKQTIKAPQLGMPHGHFTAKGASSLPGFSAPARRGAFGEEIDTSSMKKVGAQMGSNPGGVFEDDSGKKFYVKKGQTKDHVRNELTAAALADLAGMPTLHYRPVKGGEHVATEMEKLDKNNASKLSEAERREAYRDFVVHAWLGNYDAIGTGGDNIGTIKGVPVPLDFGGALEYRAQGKPKGEMFGSKAKEIETMRDPGIAPDAAKFYRDMTPSEMRESARYVTRIPDDDIRDVVEEFGGKASLAEKLIARKNDIAARAKFFGAEGDPQSKDGTVVIPVGEKLPVKELNGVKFSSWRPPADWAAVDGQAEIDEPELVVPDGKKAASGVVIREPDGRVWIVQPRGGYGGYEATFPKGRVDEGLSLQANAIKEAYEESGLKVRITGFGADREGDLTMTRYYTAVREGGDPSQHDDETEGVVLVPQSKADGFLNRKRDRETLGLDEFKESDHPRDPKGQFAESGSSGGSSGGAAPPTKSKKTAFGGLWKTGGDNPAANFQVNAAHVLGNKTNAGVSYRQMLAFMIKEAPKHGHEGYVEALKKKLAESLILSAEKAKTAGNEAGAAKALEVAKKFGAKVEPPAPPPKPSAAPPPKFPAPTPQELEKAKKTVALQMQYVPNVPESTAGQKEAQKLLAEFNEKYSGKAMTSTPALIQKVNDFKLLAAKMAAIKAAEAEVLKAEQAKAQAEAKKNAAALAAKAKEEAKAAAEKNAAVMKELGITEQEAEGFGALVKMMGQKSADVVAAFKNYEAKAKAHNYPVTGFQAALISNYSNGGYRAINKSLREGAWTPAQHVYVKMVNKALAAMPTYEGDVIRNASLTTEQLSKYLNPGHVIMEDAFMSSSTGSVFDGNVQFRVTAIGKRGASIKKLSNYPQENEVLFQARTFFHVDKVEQKGGKHVVHMTEWED